MKADNYEQNTYDESEDDRGLDESPVNTRENAAFQNLRGITPIVIYHITIV